MFNIKKFFIKHLLITSIYINIEYKKKSKLSYTFIRSSNLFSAIINYGKWFLPSQNKTWFLYINKGFKFLYYRLENNL